MVLYELVRFLSFGPDGLFTDLLSIHLFLPFHTHVNNLTLATYVYFKLNSNLALCTVCACVCTSFDLSPYGILSVLNLSASNLYTMSRGAISIIFSNECTEVERSELLSLFDGLDHRVIRQDDLVKGFVYRIGDILQVLNRRNQPERALDVATQTDSIERSISPSIFQDVTGRGQLYGGNVLDA